MNKTSFPDTSSAESLRRSWGELTHVARRSSAWESVWGEASSSSSSAPSCYPRPVVRGSVWSLDIISQIGASRENLRQLFRPVTDNEFLLRFGLGGLVTAVAGVIGMQFGPVIGGLFLAFPSIFPAAATLVEKHEAKKKEQTGRKGKKRGRTAAGADAAGAAVGSFGLVVFGFVVWELSTSYDRGVVLCTASLAWLSMALFCWLIRKQL